MKKLEICIVLGGPSSEREVSLASGHSMQEALAGAGPEVARVVLCEWCADGSFIVDGERTDAAGALARLAAFDACLLAVHGGAGEDGTIQGWLELAGVAYSGSGVAASATAMDKHLTRLLATSLGIDVAPGVLVASGGWADVDDAARSQLEALNSGYFVKDRFGGSSIGTRYCAEFRGLPSAVEEARSAGAQVVVEAAIAGVEVTCAVIDEEAGAPTAWPLVEVEPAAGHFFDYEQKYRADGALEHCPPRSIAPERQRDVQERARRLYIALGCEGVARVDFIVPHDPARPPILLEANTLPGMTPRSLVPLAAAAVGIDYRTLCIELALRARRRRTTRRHGAVPH